VPRRAHASRALRTHARLINGTLRMSPPELGARGVQGCMRVPYATLNAAEAASRQAGALALATCHAREGGYASTGARSTAHRMCDIVINGDSKEDYGF
jgi:hypothetical protein